ncbi:glutamate synthase subunit beta [Bacteroides mediterraneensis]|uniref:Glutamate synthase subunit beta n=1 Tax=Bacteroides mediterraneensis TaxID=1841856 RepID=A0ABS2ES18_9BACE|nr:glutamate synthase subunit beta [Bacteroides mediterraneensis]MBM6757460.1 glutamate synthase subunit beta [Bacteroides mediterraneensis]MBM6782382.1 glutamate synthase subunit beta [Bacteroides mediterraneensis]
MGNPKAFLTVPRQEAGYRPIHDRIRDFSEVEQTLNTSERKLQASRCMDCGVPFCHWACPISNRPPEFQDAIYKGKWKEAYEILSETNDFPEFTGRICPALCEKSCVLKLSMDAPVTIREDEAAVIEAAFREGYVQPRQYKRNGKSVAVIGSGPAGLAAANQLNQKGYTVTVFEKLEYVGGLLRFGIPNFKLSKSVIDRRIAVMEAEGITFQVNTDIDVTHLPEGFDAYCVCTGTPQARDLNIPGRELKGIHFAMEMLAQQNRVLAGQQIPKDERISAKGKNVLVIGGGDTGSDCIGTSNRQGALSVTQIEIMPKPPVGYNPKTPWPQWPIVLKTSSSHEEGCVRRWSLTSNRFLEKDGKVCGVEVEEVEWIPGAEGERPVMKPTGKKEVLKAELVLLAMGFLRPVQPEFPENVFVAGDAATGASLVVKCIAGGRKAAADIDAYLSRK